MDTNRAAVRPAVTLALCAFLVVAGFFLWAEHRAHVMGALPYLLLLACPIIHLLMHSGHRSHGGHEHGGEAPQ